MSNNENPKPKTSIFKKWWFWLVIIIILFGIIGASGGEKKSNNQQNSSNASTATSTIKEGTVVSGIGREELEKKYNESKNQSKFKADEYANSIKGQSVVWVAKVEDVDTNVVTNTPYIRMKMGVYSINVYDPAKKWVDLNKNTIVKIEGKINEISEFVGITVYVDADNITKI